MSRLFISHATADRKFVERELLGLLRALGFNPWFAEEDIKTTQQWERSILGALKSSRWFVLVMSPRSAESEWVKDEVAWAIDEMPEHVIPILIDDCEPRDFHIRVPRIQYLDFRKQIRESREELVKLLVDSEYKPYVTDVDASDPLRKQRERFWKPIVDDGLQIVLGRFLQFSSFQQSGFLGVGDAVAMTEIQSCLGRMRISGVPISYADRLDGDALKTNLVLLGGPDANTLTRETVNRVNSTLKFGNPAQHEIALFDSKEGRTFIPRRSAADKIENDFGIVYWCGNPFEPRKRVLLGAGSFGYGTWACVRYVLSEAFLSDPLVRDGGNVECLIEADILWEAPQRIRAHIVRELPKSA
jgi:hypothetical protein